jgi:hypothetical protein
VMPKGGDSSLIKRGLGCGYVGNPHKGYSKIGKEVCSGLISTPG